MHPKIKDVTDRIIARSRATRADYLERMKAQGRDGRSRDQLSCGNLAHAFAAAPAGDKLRLRAEDAVNIGIVNSYNDMLSAHQPLGEYPDLIKEAAREVGATAQVAGGTPAMCDGVTQGQPGMELSLFSREVIAMSTAVALSHNMFDAALCLGVCDKIVPGLLMGAASFGHLPIIFVPAGPMTSGLPNKEKARIRALYARGEIGREELLDAESGSYHSSGTCTFYGTANSNQMLMELMGLHLPGTAFVNPGTPLRAALTKAAATRSAELARDSEAGGRFGAVLSEKAIVNGIVGLMATGGSTNHALHIVAIARAVGVQVTCEDLSEISSITPLLARVYPNGFADVNQFHAAGGLAFVTRELLRGGWLHGDVDTVAGGGLEAYTREPFLTDEGGVEWRDGTTESLDAEILRGAEDPFDTEGGLRMLKGNLGLSVIKISAVAPEHRVIEAPAAVFHDQQEFIDAFKRGDLERDVVAVVRFQGPRANGMPELHKLSPQLSVLQDKGFKVALITDGRMSGASGKTPAAIHVTPEADAGGPLARVRDGDIIRLDADAGELDVKVDEAEFMTRPLVEHAQPAYGLGRELFTPFRDQVGAADAGASVFFAS